MFIIVFNKPFNVVCQFSAHGDDTTLAEYIDVQGVYPAGRLDKDSEGLLVLTDTGDLQHRICQPEQKLPKGYWVQVEGIPDDRALAKLRQGILLKDGMTRPAEVNVIPEPSVWERNPPIRQRKSIPTTWLDITIHEGRNRQVRRMTAAVGHPTLRLIRYRVGPWYLNNLAVGKYEQRSLPASMRHSAKTPAPQQKTSHRQARKK